MNIESSNISSLVSNTTSVETMPQPAVEGGVVSGEAFSGALVTQMGLLNTTKLTEPQPLPGIAIVGMPIAQTPTKQPNPQSFAALTGNDLPSPTKMAGIDHEAVLGAVTDTLRYIAMGTTTGNKVTEAEQNLKDVMAMAAPVPSPASAPTPAPTQTVQNQTEKVATAALAPATTSAQPAQNQKGVMAMMASIGQNLKGMDSTVDSSGKKLKDDIVVAAPVGQNVATITAPAGQNQAATTAAPNGQNQPDAAAMTALAGQNETDIAVEAVPVAVGQKTTAVMAAVTQNPKGADPKTISLGQKPKDLATTTLQNQKNGVVANNISVGQTQKDVATKEVSAGQSLDDTVAPIVLVETGTKKATVKSMSPGKNLDAVPVIVLDGPNKQNKTAKTVSASQNNNVIPTPASTVVQNQKDAVIAPSQQTIKVADTLTTPVVKQNKGEMPIRAKQNKGNGAETVVLVQQTLKEATPPMAVPAKMDFSWTKSPKKQAGDEAQVADANPKTAEVALPTIAPPAPMPPEQRKAATNEVPVDVMKEASLIKPLTEEAKPKPSAKTPNNVPQREMGFHQTIQAKQDINLKNIDNAGQTEKSASFERQVLSPDLEKPLPSRAAMDIAPPTRIENKVDVPAITKPLSHPEWNKDLGDRIVWMSSRAIPAAEIKLNPQHLGPISVRVDVVDDQATVVFTAQHALTREALESSIPKLREMMSVQHLNLADVSVSQGSSSDQGRSQAQNFGQTTDGRGQAPKGGAIEIIGDVEQEIDNGQATVSNGLLSIYA